MKRLPDWFFAEEQARLEQESEDKIATIKGELCFYSFLAAGAAVVIGGVVAISRLAVYPLVKKFADSWE